MVKNMHHIVIESIKVVGQKVSYLSISCDEVNTIHNQFWCNVHVYVVDGFKMMPLSLNLERVISGSNVNNLT
jgi:hypothetical protein